MDLLALSDFNLVAAHGGFGKASRASGKPKATLSRRVMELEEALGVRLLDRGSRSLKLTKEGRSLFARTEGLLREIDEAGAAISAGQDHLRGSLRVSAPVLLAHVALGRIAARFANAYPDVRLEITAEDRMVDPVEEGYDVVIRINPAPDDRLVGRCFLHDRLVVVAPPSVTRPPCRAGDLKAGRLACCGAVEGRPVAIWALHSSRRLVSGKVTAFLRCLVAAFPDRSL